MWKPLSSNANPYWTLFCSRRRKRRRRNEWWISDSRRPWPGGGNHWMIICNLSVNIICIVILMIYLLSSDCSSCAVLHCTTGIPCEPGETPKTKIRNYIFSIHQVSSHIYKWKYNTVSTTSCFQETLILFKQAIMLVLVSDKEAKHNPED